MMTNPARDDLKMRNAQRFLKYLPSSSSAGWTCEAQALLKPPISVLAYQPSVIPN